MKKGFFPVIAIVCVAVAVLGVAIFMNSESITGNAARQGRLNSLDYLKNHNYVTGAESSPQYNKILSRPVSTLFEKGYRDCFQTYSNGKKLDGGLKQVCINTGTKDKSGTDSIVRFYKGTRAGMDCVYILEIDGSGDGPGWYVESIDLFPSSYEKYTRYYLKEWFYPYNDQSGAGDNLESIMVSILKNMPVGGLPAQMSTIGMAHTLAFTGC